MKVVDLTNLQFGDLTVQGRGESHRTYGGTAVIYWEVLCGCGFIKSISGSNLKCGRVLTCGRIECPYFQVRRQRRMKVSKGNAGLRQAVRFYVNKCKRKNIPFRLSQNECRKLFIQPCVYCGSPPSNVARKESTYGEFIYSGIDRIDAAHGYISTNVQSCCWICNNMKQRLSHAAFIQHIKTIAGRF